MSDLGDALYDAHVQELLSKMIPRTGPEPRFIDITQPLHVSDMHHDPQPEIDKLGRELAKLRAEMDAVQQWILTVHERGALRRG